MTKSKIKQAVLFGLCFTLLLAALGADGILPAPKPSSLEVFTGKVESIKLLEKTKSWKVVLASPVDHRVFYIPGVLCGSLENDVKVGETATAKLHRRMPLGVIRAWEMEASGNHVISYQESKALQRSPKESAVTYLIVFIGMCISMIFLQKVSKSNKNA